MQLAVKIPALQQNHKQNNGKNKNLAALDGVGGQMGRENKGTGT